MTAVYISRYPVLPDILSSGNVRINAPPAKRKTIGDSFFEHAANMPQAERDANDCALTIAAVRDSECPRSSATVARTPITPALKPRITFAAINPLNIGRRKSAIIDTFFASSSPVSSSEFEIRLFSNNILKKAITISSEEKQKAIAITLVKGTRAVKYEITAPTPRDSNEDIIPHIESIMPYSLFRYI